MFYKWARVIWLVLTFGILNSCASDSVDTRAEASDYADYKYAYTVSETQLLELINKYRLVSGLSTLNQIDYLSVKSEEHNNYMISSSTVSHAGFVTRSEDITKMLGAIKVGENVAYNYKSAKGAFDAWITSAEHKNNILGDFTHFGISIREDSITKKIYYTNILVKK